jgi:hypothetical protein
VQSDPNAYQQRLEQINQQAGEDQPVFNQPWLSPEQQAARQTEFQNQQDYQPSQLAQAPTQMPQEQPPVEPQPAQPPTEPQPEMAPQSEQPAQPTQPEYAPQPEQPYPPEQPSQQPEQPMQPEQQPYPPEQPPQAPAIEIGPHATIDHSHDNDPKPQNSWKVTQTIGGYSENPEAAPTPPPPKKSRKKLTVFMSTLVFAAVGAAVVIVFGMISRAGAKTLSCNINGQNNNVPDLVSYEVSFNVRLAGDSFSDITTGVSLMFRNSVDAQNYINSGGEGRVSEAMVASDAEYVRSNSGAILQDSRVNFSSTYKSNYMGILGGVSADLNAYHGTPEQLVNEVKMNLEDIGYTCNFK